MGLEDLAKYGPTGLGIASLAVSYLIVQQILKRMDKVDERHEKAFIRLANAIDKNTQTSAKTNVLIDQNTRVSDETNTFLRTLNGKLVKTVKEKIEA